MAKKCQLHRTRLQDTKVVVAQTTTDIERNYAEAAHAFKVLQLLRERRIKPEGIANLVDICANSFRAGETPAGCVWRIMQQLCSSAP